MSNNGVVFCTLAYGDTYRALSRRELITSYNHYASDYKLVIATDEPSYYDDDVIQNKNIIPIKIVLNFDMDIGMFPFNIKMVPIDHALRMLSPECIVFLDADSRINRHQDFDNFLTLDDGLSVIMGDPSLIADIPNPTIRQKAERLSREGELIYQFKEAGLIFRVKSVDKMQRFIAEWKDILITSLTNNICQHAECIDIGLACQRSGLPIMDLRDNHNIYKLMGYGLFSTYSPYTDEYIFCLM